MALKSTKTVPKHLGLIMDGNRRWAKSHGLTTLQGHKRGSEQFIEVTDYAQKLGIDYVTVFAFSTENWSRTKEEVGYLMKLFVRVLNSQISTLNERGSKLKIIGSYEGVPSNVVKALTAAEELTKNNTNGVLGICFNYGGQAEIVEAAKKLIKSGISADKIDDQKFSEYLYAPDVPPMDLIIRTSGEQRLSGFMLWRSAYAELYFTETHWPDFGKEELDIALAEFAKRQRRYGA